MPTIEITRQHLLEAVKQLPADEFDEFIERAIALRPPATSVVLSARETELLSRINRDLPEPPAKRSRLLTQRLKKGRLTDEEHRELLALTHEAESLDADRAAALLELAKARRTPLPVLMKQLGIKPRPVHG